MRHFGGHMFLYRLVLVTTERDERIKKELLWKSDGALGDDPSIDFFVKNGILEETEEEGALDAVDEIAQEDGRKLGYSIELEYRLPDGWDEWSLRHAIGGVKAAIEPIEELDINEDGPLVDVVQIVDP